MMLCISKTLFLSKSAALLFNLSIPIKNQLSLRIDILFLRLLIIKLPKLKSIKNPNHQ